MGPDSSWTVEQSLETVVAKPSAAEVTHAVLGTCHFEPAVMRKAQGAVDGQMVADVVYAEASSVDVAVEGLTPLWEGTYPRHRHHRRPHHSCLESLRAPCVHVVVHTGPISHGPFRHPKELPYILIPANCFVDVSRGELVQFLVVTKYYDGDVDRAED